MLSAHLHRPVLKDKGKNMSSIKFANVTKNFGKTTVLDQLNIEVKAGERLILLGPSGCGKSTILRLIAGLADATAGDIYFGNQRVNHLSAGDRNVAMVFQNYALYPHMTVKENVTYALKAHKVPKTEIEHRATEALSLLRLSGLENRKPKELSGGQRQRVALARAMVKRSDFFLLDEPLSNLDAQLRHHARKELVKIHERFGQTFVYVTHDQVEAMTLGNRVALMHGGTLQMLDTPANIFNRPANVFTAKFIGSPSCNTVEASFAAGSLQVGNHTLPLSAAWQKQIEKANTNCFILGLRPEHITLSTEPVPGAIAVEILSVEDYGGQRGLYFQFGTEEWVIMTEQEQIHRGDTVYFVLNQDRMHLFNQKTEHSIGYPAEISQNQPKQMRIGA